jgi:hypothetical protein
LQSESDAGKWSTVDRFAVGSPTGKERMSGRAIGRYTYRVQLLSSAGTMLSQSPGQFLYSYGSVSLGTICRTFTQFPWQCTSGKEQVGFSAYAYTAEVGMNDGIAQYPGFSPVWSGQNTSCRSGIITFVADSTGHTSYAEILRSNVVPQVSSARDGKVGSLRAVFDGGAWRFKLSTTGSGLPQFWLTGTWDCYTPSGR